MDAERYSPADDAPAVLSSAAGEVEVPVDVTDEQFVDELTGTAALSGQRVKVRAAQPAAL